MKLNSKQLLIRACIVALKTLFIAFLLNLVFVTICCHDLFSVFCTAFLFLLIPVSSLSHPLYPDYSGWPHTLNWFLPSKEAVFPCHCHRSACFRWEWMAYKNVVRTCSTCKVPFDNFAVIQCDTNKADFISFKFVLTTIFFTLSFQISHKYSWPSTTLKNKAVFAQTQHNCKT